MKKVLVIDDDPDILEAVQMVLKFGGYESFTVVKSDEIWQKIKKYHPDLIILDVLLSGNDGRAICRTLKDDESQKNIPIVMMSAHPDSKKTAAECGADGFVSKPFSITELLDEVNRLI